MIMGTISEVCRSLGGAGRLQIMPLRSNQRTIRNSLGDLNRRRASQLRQHSAAKVAPKPMRRSESMNGHVYGLSEIVGTSTQGVDDAIRVGVQRAARTLRGLDWFEVTDIRGHLVNGEIEHFQVTMKIGFRMEDPVTLNP